MESGVANSNKVSLKDVTAFLSKQTDDIDSLVSIEERTDYAINLLQSLPCARYAVLEKIGEVFFNEAQSYSVELERKHLEGMPPISENIQTCHDIQIKKIKQVLVSSIESNSKAWAPVIFQWAVQTCSQICGQYGTNRHLTIQERTQMWLACSATSSLIGIIITCLRKIIQKNKENCLKCLLQATLTYTPFFNWALAHICCAFPEIVLEVFIKNALEAFTNQSRKSEVIKETMLNVFELVVPIKENYIQDAIRKLVMLSLVDVKEMKKNAKRETLCVIPFLLHLAVNQVELVVPIVDEILDTLTIDHLMILYEQSKLREDVLQRGIIRRTVNCVRKMNGSTYKVLQCLIKFSCMEDSTLCKEYPDLAKSVQSVCFAILDSLLLMLKHEVCVYVHYNKESTKKMADDVVQKVPFLSSLAAYTKQCCRQLISSSGTKKEILQDFIILMAAHEGRDKMKEILAFIMVNATMASNKSTLKACINEFELTEDNIFQETLQDLLQNIDSASNFSPSQISVLLKNLLGLLKDESEDIENSSVIDQARKHVGIISKLLVSNEMSCGNHPFTKDAFEILKLICCEDLRLSEYANIVQHVISIFFTTLKNVQQNKQFKGDSVLEDCEEMLILLLANHKALQQYVIHLLIDGISNEDEVEKFSSEPEEPTIKADLIEKNVSMAGSNRIHSNVTSILYKDGLKLNKRKLEEIDQESFNIFRQHFMAMLFSVLSANPGYSCPRMDGESDKNNTSFHTTWGDTKFSRQFPNAYAYAANVLVEKVCPESVPACPWPDEDFLKYTIERDLKVKKKFEDQILYWDILELISSARPSLYQCSVLVQSLFGMSLTFWQGNRHAKSTATPTELNSITRLLFILKQAGWLPSEFDSIADIFPFIKPKELYNILSAVWKYLKVNNRTPDRFIDRDSLGRPQLTSNPEHLQIVRSVIKIVFFQNISTVGHMCKRFLCEQPL